MPSEVRGETREKMRRDRLNEREQLLSLGPNFKLSDIRRRWTVWALTEAGPFRSYLHKYHLAEESECRFCHESEETAQHLLVCDHFDFNITSDSETEEFETCIAIIINELNRSTN